MRHRMHYGPAPDSEEAVMISRFHARTTSTPRATLSALSWAADKAGMSYGRFLQTLGPGDEGVIQGQYETFHNRGYLFDAVGGGTTLSGVFFHLRGGNMRRTVVYY